MNHTDLNGVSISSDRGLNQPTFVSHIVTNGGVLQGTVPHNKIAKIQAFHAHHNNIVASAADQAVTLSGSAPNCHNFSESGYKATYWAEQEIVPNSKKLYLLAMRQGHGKSVYLMTKYSRLLQNISEKYLRWVYDIPAPILPIFSYKVLGFCTDQHTLQLTLNLWHACRERFRNEPCGPVNKINPALITHWNHTKGAVDVDTREKANHQAGYRHLSVVSRLIDTLIMEATLNASKIFKWVHIENELDRIESTDSLKRHFHRTTLSTVLKSVSAIFRQRVLSQQAAVSGLARTSALTATGNAPTAAGLVQRCQFTEANFRSQESILRRTSGNHIFTRNKKGLKCALCGKRTMYMCPLCCVRACVMAKKGELKTCYEKFHDPNHTMRKAARATTSSPSKKRTGKTRGPPSNTKSQRGVSFDESDHSDHSDDTNNSDDDEESNHTMRKAARATTSSPSKKRTGKTPPDDSNNSDEAEESQDEGEGEGRK